MELLYGILLFILVLVKIASCVLIKNIASDAVKRWIILLNPIFMVVFLGSVWFGNDCSVIKCLPITMLLIMLEIIFQIVIHVIKFFSGNKGQGKE